MLNDNNRLYAVLEIIALLIMMAGSWYGMRFHIGESGMTLYPARRFFFPKKYKEDKLNKEITLVYLEHIRSEYRKKQGIEESDDSDLYIKSVNTAISSVKNDFKGGI